ncbi:MAG: 16S rRNA (cytosine(1402)-N(4))-methyltransferase RsmH [Elusimicrobia bacterium]|nr:16S rRNA (cytosine(1402)-N(4))-methyltransferase RsmH [Elusimicrobiota bacterium]
MSIHFPVMLNEVLQYLDIKKNGTYIDCTLGGAGHTAEIIKKLSNKGKLFCIDWDEDAVKKSKNRFKQYKNIVFINDNFANIENICKRYKINKVNGILFDLGFSSLQIDDEARGFSFNYDAPLDMRFAKDNPITAGEMLNVYSEEKLSGILKEYAEERFADNIAKKVVFFRRAKKIETTKELVDIIRKATPAWYHNKRIHFATKTFQALRIAVNREVENIVAGFESALKIVSPGGRIIAISFHSIEHRLLKNIFKAALKNNLIKLIVKKPIFPGYEEIRLNHRSRSAQMRIVERL